MAFSEKLDFTLKTLEGFSCDFWLIKADWKNLAVKSSNQKQDKTTFCLIFNWCIVKFFSGQKYRRKSLEWKNKNSLRFEKCLRQVARKRWKLCQCFEIGSSPIRGYFRWKILVRWRLVWPQLWSLKEQRIAPKGRGDKSSMYVKKEFFWYLYHISLNNVPVFEKA